MPPRSLLASQGCLSRFLSVWKEGEQRRERLVPCVAWQIPGGDESGPPATAVSKCVFSVFPLTKCPERLVPGRTPSSESLVIILTGSSFGKCWLENIKEIGKWRFSGFFRSCHHP